MTLTTTIHRVTRYLNARQNIPLDVIHSLATDTGFGQLLASDVRALLDLATKPCPELASEGGRTGFDGGGVKTGAKTPTGLPGASTEAAR